MRLHVLTPVLSFAAMITVASVSVVSAQQGSALPIQGELKQWHKLTFDFIGPESSESATPNPFTDYRLDVTFSHPVSGAIHVVPGYFAADGHAAHTSATAGTVWRVHFAPGEVGSWNYAASFRTGTDVAVADDPLAGTSAGHFDGVSGTFVIDPTDKAGRDFRAKGRLEYVGKHHLRFAGTGEYFMKAGTDSPENLLAYADFDGDFQTDGQKDELIKTWAPHVADWQDGDPVWQGDKGKGLIGALNYLAAEGLNAFSFLTLNINGDDRNVFPYTTYGERDRMDVSRLDQWEIVFEHATRTGLYLHFKTQETENEKLLDSGNLGNQRKLYYRELIARFSHHLALNWNLGEEIIDATTTQKRAWAQYFHDHDPYRHHIVIHNGDSHKELMGSGSALTGMSLQMNESDFSDTYFRVQDYVEESTDQGKPWVVACDEPGNAGASLRPDADPGDSHLDARRDALWATILAGGAGIEFYFGYNYEHSDLTCQDFRSRDLFWDVCRHALEFFESQDFPFQLLTHHNELVSGNGDNANRCLARIGDTYLVQLRSSGSHTLDLTAATGTFTVKWFNPRDGGPLIGGPPVEGGGTVPLGDPPDSPGEDWIVLVETTGNGSATNAPPAVDAGADRTAFLTGASVDVVLSGSVDDDGLPDEFSLARTWSMVSGPAPVEFSDPLSATTTASFSAAGTYALLLAASDSDLSDADDLVVTVLFPDTGGEVGFSPVHDAFTDAGANDNGTVLRVAGGSQTSYLQFDLSLLASAPAAAVLRLTANDDTIPAPVTLRLFAAASDDWTEDTLSGATAPAPGDELAVFSGPLEAGQTIGFDLSAHLAAPGNYSFILAADEGFSAAFLSDEAPHETGRPRLTVTTAPNGPPDFSGYLVATPVNQTLAIPNGWILAAAADPDGDPLSLAPTEASSTAGGRVVVDEGTLSYTPAIDFSGEDSFLLKIGDGRGGETGALLQILVVESDGIGGRVPEVDRSPDGAVTLRFHGDPGFPYRIERSADLQTWLTIGAQGGGFNGEVEFIDPDPPVAAAFYRVASP